MSFRKTSFSVYLPDGTRCRGAYYPGKPGVVGLHVHGFRSSVTHQKARFFVDHAVKNEYGWANYDLPCHGMSEGNFRSFRVSVALASLLEVLNELSAAPVVLLGSSIGAWLSMLAAKKLFSTSRQRKITIAGAVLIAPAFDFVQQYLANQPKEAMMLWRKTGIRQFKDIYDNSSYELEYAVVNDGLSHNLLHRSVHWNFPVRIFHGDQDEVVPLASSQRFCKLAGDSDVTLHTIRGGDHSLSDHLPRIAKELDAVMRMAQDFAPTPDSETDYHG